MTTPGRRTDDDAAVPGPPRARAAHRAVRPARAGRRRVWAGAAMIGAGVLLTAGAVWIVVTALLARAQLQQVRDGITSLRADLVRGDLSAAAHERSALAGHADRAHDLTTGPAWAVAAALPGADPVRTVRGVAAAVDTLAHGALPELVTVRRTLDPARLRSRAGRIDVAAIAAAAPAVHRADVGLDAVRHDVAALPSTSWLGPVDSARRSLLSQLGSLSATVHEADVAATVLPPMLGDGGVRRYFVAFQNGAEARGTGGLPGAFGILQARDGSVRFTSFDSDSALDGVGSGLDLGADFDELYGSARSTSLYVNSNISPNFPYAARIWTAMWQRRTGQRLDGAVALDPAALGDLLDVTGPATLPDGSSISGGDITQATQVQAYARFGARTAARRAYLVTVARAAADRVTDSDASPRSLIDAARRGVQQRRILVWSADPRIEATLQGTALSGAIPDTGAPYVGLSVVNDGGDKLDTYLHRSVVWRRAGCGGTRTVTATVTLTNDAPAGLPRSVTDRTDPRTYPISPGDNRLEVAWFGTRGGALDAATLDGRTVGASVGAERGHPVFVVDVELPRGATRVLVLHLREPAGHGTPVVLRQPLVGLPVIRVDDARCP